MLPTEFVDGRGLADDGSGPTSPPSPASPPNPPCLPDFATTPEMPCLGPTPTSFENFSGDDSTTILAFAVMGLVGLITSGRLRCNVEQMDGMDHERVRLFPNP